MMTTPRPRSGYTRMAFQKPAPAPKCSTQLSGDLVGRRSAMVDAAHGAGGLRVEDLVSVNRPVAQVHPQELAGVHDVADQAAVRRPVDVERVQRKIWAVPVSGHPLGQQAAERRIGNSGRLDVAGGTVRSG